MTGEETIPVTRVSLEHTGAGQHAACATLAEANAVLTRWSWSDPQDQDGNHDADTAAIDTVYCVVHWADGTRLVVRYDLPRDPGGARADLGAAIRAQCEYSAGRRRPPEMSLVDYQRLIWGAGANTTARYNRMLDTLEM